MTLPESVRALRYGCAISHHTWVHPWRVTGEHAWEAMDYLCPLELRLLDSQVRQTLLLNEDGTPFADCVLALDDEDFLLLLEGPGDGEVDAWFHRHVPDGLDVQLIDLAPTHDVWGLDGPYSWQLMAAVVGPEVMGLPYLTLFREDGWLCLRTGKTGEFGYDLLVEKARVPEVLGQIRASGIPLDLVEVGQDELDLCALENFFFNIRQEGKSGATPLELQLQWRISRKKVFVGSAALQARRLEGCRHRLTTLLSDTETRQGQLLYRDGVEVGRVVNSRHSPLLGKWILLAQMDLSVAWPGLSGFHIGEPLAAGTARTVCPPLLHNRSLAIDLRKHRYVSRDRDVFPPVVVT